MDPGYDNIGAFRGIVRRRITSFVENRIVTGRRITGTHVDLDRRRPAALIDAIPHGPVEIE